MSVHSRPSIQYQDTKSKGIFPDAKGQLTLESVVVHVSGQSSFYGCPRYLQE